MEDEEDQEFLDELYAIEIKANSVETCEDFIEFLDMLKKEILEDDELNKRLQLEFFHITRRKLNFICKISQDDAEIEIPDQLDWCWLARLFLIGAFEN